jgi:hypothetical protein
MLSSTHRSLVSVFPVQFRYKNSARLTHFSDAFYMPIFFYFVTIIMFNGAYKLRSSSLLYSFPLRRQFVLQPLQTYRDLPLKHMHFMNLAICRFQHICTDSNAEQLHLITYLNVFCVWIWIKVCWIRFNHTSSLQSAVMHTDILRKIFPNRFPPRVFDCDPVITVMMTKS